MRMTLLRLRDVRAARARVVDARTRWARTRQGKLARTAKTQANAHPLIFVGIAAGAGLALSWVSVRPWRHVGVISMLYRQAMPLFAHLLTMASDGDEA